MILFVKTDQNLSISLFCGGIGLAEDRTVLVMRSADEICFVPKRWIHSMLHFHGFCVTYDKINKSYLIEINSLFNTSGNGLNQKCHRRTEEGKRGIFRFWFACYEFIVSLSVNEFYSFGFTPYHFVTFVCPKLANLFFLGVHLGLILILTIVSVYWLDLKYGWKIVTFLLLYSSLNKNLSFPEESYV